MDTPIKLLVIFVDETDRWDGLPLFHIGVMGYGSHLRVHHKGLFGVSDDRPVTISVVDSEPKLRQVLPEIRPMVKEGLVILLDAELIP